MRIVSDEVGWDSVVRKVSRVHSRFPLICNTQNALATLGHNLAVAGALCVAHRAGYAACADLNWPDDRSYPWFPNVDGRPHPRFRP